MKKINIEVVDPYQEYFKFNKVYCEHNGVKIQSLVDILGYVDELQDDTLVSCNFDYILEKGIYLSLIHISEPTRLVEASRMPSSA